MQAFLNCHDMTQICAHFFTIKVNYEACYVIFLETDTILLKFSN